MSTVGGNDDGLPGWLSEPSRARAVETRYRRLAADHPCLPVDAQWMLAKFSVNGHLSITTPVLPLLLTRPELDSEVEEFVLSNVRRVSPDVMRQWLLARGALVPDLVSRVMARETRKTVLRQAAGIPGLSDGTYLRAMSLAGPEAVLVVAKHVVSSSPAGQETARALLELFGADNPPVRVHVIGSLLRSHAGAAACFVVDDTPWRSTNFLIRELPWSASVEAAACLESRVLVEARRLLAKAAKSQASAPKALLVEVDEWLGTVKWFVQHPLFPSPDRWDEWKDVVAGITRVVQANAAKFPWSIIGVPQWLSRNFDPVILDRTRSQVLATETVEELSMLAWELKDAAFDWLVEEHLLSLLADPVNALKVGSFRNLSFHHELVKPGLFNVGVGLVSAGHWDAALRLVGLIRRGSIVIPQSGRVLSEPSPTVLAVEYAGRLADVSGRDIVDVLVEMWPFADQSTRGVPVTSLARYLAAEGLNWKRFVLALSPDDFDTVWSGVPALAGEMAVLVSSRLLSQAAWDAMAELWPVLSASAGEVLDTAAALVVSAGQSDQD